MLATNQLDRNRKTVVMFIQKYAFRPYTARRESRYGPSVWGKRMKRTTYEKNKDKEENVKKKRQNRKK